MFIQGENDVYINLDHITNIRINTDDNSYVRVFAFDVRNQMYHLYREAYGPTKEDKKKCLENVRKNIEQVLIIYQNSKRRL